MPMEEPVEEEKVGKDVDMGEVPPIRDSVPEQVVALAETLLVAAGICTSGPGNQVAGQGPAASLRAWGKAPTVHVE